MGTFKVKNIKSARTNRGLLAIGKFAIQTAGPALQKRGFHRSEIISHWEEIVTPVFAIHTSPEKLVFPRDRRTGGTLTIQTPAPLALEIQHSEQLLLERVNTFFGYRAVDKIILKHSTFMDAKKENKRTRRITIDRTSIHSIESQTEDIHSKALRKALRSLGKSIKTAELQEI
ncbi:MAG: hypothetical protein CMM44_10600 [Rhodospirillaceae bacterium]|nr:hypothetical protein [Rhodospirillaceae bacterium]